MRFPILLAFYLASAATLQAANAALARPARDRDGAAPGLLQAARPAPTLRDESSTFSADMAAREIQRLHGGRILAVQPDGAGYRVKVLKDGEVRIYQVDP